MRKARLLFGCVAAGLLAIGLALAAEAAKEVTLNGEIGCAKCAFAVAEECATAIKVEAGGKSVIYYFDPVADKKYHSEICQTVNKGKVTGTVLLQGDRQIITVASLEYAKK